MTSSPVELAFEQRALRAELLARDAAAAREPLDFAAGLYRTQGAVAATIEAWRRNHGLRGHLDADLDGLGAAFTPILRFAAERGPSALGAAAEARLSEHPRARLCSWWSEDASGRGDYLSRALLRPYAEVLAAAGVPPQPRAAAQKGDGACPFCGGPPWVAARRGAADGDGARRLLVCALCGGEWPVNRVSCPACTEATPDKLPSFQSDRYPTVRIETCATCRSYLKSIDLTLDARAIPEVDELLSLSMDLWAAEQGYTRIEPGIAGI